MAVPRRSVREQCFSLPCERRGLAWSESPVPQNVRDLVHLTVEGDLREEQAIREDDGPQNSAAAESLGSKEPVNRPAGRRPGDRRPQPVAAIAETVTRELSRPKA